MTVERAQQDIIDFQSQMQAIEAEVGKAIIGNKDTIRSLLTSLFVGGHALLESVPGLGKTRLVQVLADVLHLKFSRIQFTPDLMPGDVVGTQVVHEDPDTQRRSLIFQPGPLFANLVLADEINRATPKTQSALLEAMQEETITVGTTSHRLDRPFLVLATQNPLEMEGTYPLPEAQLDRFFFKLKLEYPSHDDLHDIMDITTRNEEPSVNRILDTEQILQFREAVRSVPIARSVQDYAIRLTTGTHPDRDDATDSVKRFVHYGASPRGVQALVLAGKVEALRNDRPYVATQDIRQVALPALRHRVLLNFEGHAERVDIDDILREIIEKTSEPRD